MAIYGAAVPTEIAGTHGPHYLIGVASSINNGDQIEFGPMTITKGDVKIGGIGIRALERGSAVSLVFLREDLVHLIEGLQQVLEDIDAACNVSGCSLHGFPEEPG